MIIIAAFIPNTLQNPLLFAANLLGFFIDVEGISKFYLNKKTKITNDKKKIEYNDQNKDIL